MQLEFFGAAGEVTGSCHILEVGGQRVLLDCGMIQGGRKQEARNFEPFPFDASKIDAVVLSHAHIDHSGRLPLLVQRGFSGSIYTHNATCDLVEVLLSDAAHIAASAARAENRKRARQDQPPVEPLYDDAAAQGAIARLKGRAYRKPFDVVPGVSVEFFDAGHIMGSSIVQITATEEQEGVQHTRNLVFSGDLGQYNTPILDDPSGLAKADLVLMESTYGNRNHRGREATLDELGEVLAKADKAGGTLLIPAFAVGRSQEILYQLGKHYDAWNLEGWHVYLDSPMAIKATRIYWEYPHLYDSEATKLRRETDPMPVLKNLHLTRTAEESKKIHKRGARAIIIAGSGMLNGGRILHHLKERASNPKTHLMFTGYQPPGSMGRRLIDGADAVRIHGKSVEIKASVHTLGGMSAHGDQNDLLAWYRNFENKPPVYLVHGDPRASKSFAHKLRNEAGTQAVVAQSGLQLDLIKDLKRTVPDA